MEKNLYFKKLNYDSSMIKSSKFNSRTNDLEVTFKNDIAYKFKDVSDEDYESFSNADSAGKGFNQYIKKYNGTPATN